MDSTHVKANASRASEERVESTEEPSVYWEQLGVYEEEELVELVHYTGTWRGKSSR